MAAENDKLSFRHWQQELQLQFEFDANILCHIMEEAGYDAVAGEVASGRKERSGRVCTADVDRGGRVKFACTEMEQQPTTSAATVDGREYQVAVEHIKTVTITTQLGSVEELREALSIMEQVAAGKAPSP